MSSATVKTSQATYKQQTTADEEDAFLGYELNHRSEDAYDHSNQRTHTHSEDLRSYNDDDGGYYDEKSGGSSGGK